MAHLVTRVGADLAAQIDRLVAGGVVGSRSEAVRPGLQLLVDRHRRKRVETAIVAGCAAHKQVEDEMAWADEATRRMIAEESW